MIMNASAELKPTAFRVKKPRRDDRLDERVTSLLVVKPEITIAPGGTTGWHYHDGPVVGFVGAGTLTHPGPDCVPQIFRTGDVINEPSGVANTHVGRNLGTVRVVLYVAYLEPWGDPLFEEAPAPPCDGAAG